MNVTAINDPAEIEADRVADEVVSALQSPSYTPTMAAAATPGLARASEEELLQGKRLARAGAEEELLQLQRQMISRGGGAPINDDGGLEREADAMGAEAVSLAVTRQGPGMTAPRAPAVGPEGGALPGDLEARVANSTGGSAMPGPVRQQMEAGFGADFGNVRMHLNSELAPAMGALAFAVGRDVHFGPGQFDPFSVGGQHLIAHELTHVVQQGGAPARAFDGAPGAGKSETNRTALPDNRSESLSGGSFGAVRTHAAAIRSKDL